MVVTSPHRIDNVLDMHPTPTAFSLWQGIQTTVEKVQLSRYQLKALVYSIKELLDVLEREHSAGYLRVDKAAPWFESLHASVLWLLFTQSQT